MPSVMTYLTAAFVKTSMLGIPSPVTASHPFAVSYPSGHLNRNSIRGYQRGRADLNRNSIRGYQRGRAELSKGCKAQVQRAISKAPFQFSVTSAEFIQVRYLVPLGWYRKPSPSVMST